MIINDSVTFFAIYYHNCTFNLNTIKTFQDVIDNYKYQNLILCQKDEHGGYLLTQNTFNNNNMKDIKSFYLKTKDSLRETYKDISNKFNSVEKTFYLLDFGNSDENRTQALISDWRKQIKELCNT
jgi:hypothetical protein